MKTENNKKNMKDKRPDESISSNDLAEKLRSELKHGDYVIIANKTGLSKQTIWNHLNNQVQTPSLMIIQAAIEVVNERKKQTQKLAEAIL